MKHLPIAIALFFSFNFYRLHAQDNLTINDKGYFDMPGLSVLVFNDKYTEGHQGGLSIILNDVRIASNGELRLEPAPGQWQPFSKIGERTIDNLRQSISVDLSYPDSNLIIRSFNPIRYPDLHFDYKLKVKAEGRSSVRVTIDLEKPLPSEWIGKVGFNLEIFPGEYFDKTFIMDDKSGFFPRQLNGPMISDHGNLEVSPMAEGKSLSIAPESAKQKMNIEAVNGSLQLIDGRAHHNNGWFIVRSLVPAGATSGAIEWIITPNALPGWIYEPVIQVSKVGYFPVQEKEAIIELDVRQQKMDSAILKKISPNGDFEEVLNKSPLQWGIFQRYKYLKFDFSEISEPGLYIICYGNQCSEPFKISEDIFERGVWQPTLEYFLPVQMCHMRINDRYRVWHDFCHLDDALMAPINTVHIDGYTQGDTTYTNFQSYDHVPDLDKGGWHDAGDYDLRVESQAGTVYALSLIYENFKVDYDQTDIDQDTRIVELHRPDGNADILQQIEHGVLSILGGYESLGRLYRGIICPTLRQYVMLGDASGMTDNIVSTDRSRTQDVIPDDRWVFTEENPGREIYVSKCLATASRSLTEYNDSLAARCLEVSEALWRKNVTARDLQVIKIEALVELILATNKEDYKALLLDWLPEIREKFAEVGWTVGRVKDLIDQRKFGKTLEKSMEEYLPKLIEQLAQNPYSIPYRPQIWGAGWNIQNFGIKQYFMYKTWQNNISKRAFLNSLNFVLGRHPGANTSSFVSGVGSKSAIVAYGVNRADWSYIPGGVISGTSYIQPDFPELKDWPFFWQQGEYVIGGGATNFMFLILAANQLLRTE